VASELDTLRGLATISYDPNIRPQLVTNPKQARDRVLTMVAGADIVKASDEDIAWLYPGATAVHVAREWLRYGPSLVVVTRGPAGAHAVTHAGEVAVVAWPTRITDTVGAGDSFTAGLLAALADRDLLGRDRAAALRAIDVETTREVVNFAASCAAVTVSRHGADLPYRHELAPAR
jgi:fructokinase